MMFIKNSLFNSTVRCTFFTDNPHLHLILFVFAILLVGWIYLQIELKRDPDVVRIRCLHAYLNIKYHLFLMRDANTALYLDEIGSFLQRRCRYHEALFEFENSLRLKVKQLKLMESPCDPSIGLVVSHCHIGSVLCDLGEYDRSIQSYKKAIHMLDKFDQKNYDLLGKAHSNLATAYKKCKTLEYAFKHSMIALESFEKISAESEISTVLNNMSLILVGLGNMEEAKEVCTKAIKLKLKIYGEFHPSTAVSYDNMGKMLQRNGELDDAIYCYYEALAIKLQTLGKTHLSTAQSEHDISSILISKGNFKKAKMYLEMAVYTRQKNLHAYHPLTLESKRLLNFVVENEESPKTQWQR
jgi:tetratricopeptide (TPR) repeat protein